LVAFVLLFSLLFFAHDTRYVRSQRATVSFTSSLPFWGNGAIPSRLGLVNLVKDDG
jgi:hypothetical protein